MIEYIFPVRVVDAKCTGDASLLLKKTSLQIGLSERETVAFAAGDYVVLDFGLEMCGGIRLLAFESDGAPVRLRFGESLSEACAELGEKNTTNDHAPRDFSVTLSALSDTTLGGTGFRFVRLDFQGKVTLKSAVAVNHILKKHAFYRYMGADARVEQIFETAKRTVDLCAQGSFVWDGVKRDRLVWIGDMHPEMLALTALYGRMPAIERSLDFVREQTPLPAWMNNIPMYSMWWIIILADYSARVGARDFAARQIPYLEALIAQMDACVTEDGTLAYPFCFVDWPTHGQPDEVHGARAINVIAAKKAITLLSEHGRSTDVAEALLARLLLQPISPKESKQVLGLKHFAVGLDEADRALLTSCGARGMSTFMSYYILSAVASFDKDAAIRMMKEYYGAMLDKGATTFWEDFDLSWCNGTSRIDALPTEGERDIHGDSGAFCYVGFRHSLCHGWSAGVIEFIKNMCTE